MPQTTSFFNSFGPLNPPVAGPLIPSAIKTDSITVGNVGNKTMYPVRSIINTITTTTILDYPTEPYSYISFDTDSSITFTYRGLTIGSMLIVEISGTGDVFFRSLLNRDGGVDQFIDGTGVLSAGTYVLVVFPTNIVSTSLTNPTAI